ncbi:ABC transporter ATP-binding protein [Bacillus sp. FJAT-27251]|uniref:ATP-binding cassette domain-containing protein n=1 Tax=Bacillus sp. FJAT-27251 TaxID=1684142 RepID=UPI0006A7B43C|nr:ABC transporter ATP-binding protein [Bacillus sp. FJAT-27251]
MKVVECNDLTKAYLKKRALKGLTFSIQDNKITGLIGRNGAGKTTLLKLIAGFTKETSGQIRVFGERPFNSLSVSANSIFVDDQMSFPPALQLGELLEEAARFYQNFDAGLAKRLFDYFGFEADGYHNRLSKGKTSIFNGIVGIASRSPLTIFDEPTTGMDESARKDFYRALLKDYIAHPRSIILSSHHIDEIEDLLEDVLLLKEGKQLLHEPISELKEWAYGIKGPSEKVLKASEGHDILYRQLTGADTLYAAVRDFSGNLPDTAAGAGLEVTPVRVSDLFVYLTNETKGGIDDVFRQN